MIARGMDVNSSDIPRAPDEGELPVGLIVGIVLVQSIGTVMGNLMVCVAIYIQPSLHHVTYHAICSLAVADLFAGLVAMPSYIAKKLVTEGTFYHFVCDAFRFSYFLTGYASILSLCVISIERLLAIKSPLTYIMTVTHFRVLLALAVIWIDAIGVSLLPFMPLPSGNTRECNYNPTSWWSIMVINTNVVMPFLFIVACYAYIYLIASAQLDKIMSERKSLSRSLSCGLEDKRSERRERKATVTIMIVIGLFVVCWFPSCFYYFIQKVCASCFHPSFAQRRAIVNAFVKILTFTSSFCNPIIYCWRNKEFRKAFIKILMRKTRNVAESLRSRSRSNTTQSDIDHKVTERHQKGPLTKRTGSDSRKAIIDENRAITKPSCCKRTEDISLMSENIPDTDVAVQFDSIAVSPALLTSLESMDASDTDTNSSIESLKENTSSLVPGNLEVKEDQVYPESGLTDKLLGNNSLENVDALNTDTNSNVESAKENISSLVPGNLEVKGDQVYPESGLTDKLLGNNSLENVDALDTDTNSNVESAKENISSLVPGNLEVKEDQVCPESGLTDKLVGNDNLESVDALGTGTNTNSSVERVNENASSVVPEKRELQEDQGYSESGLTDKNERNDRESENIINGRKVLVGLVTGDRDENLSDEKTPPKGMIDCKMETVV